MKIKDIMTKEIAFVDVNDTVERAAQLMEQYNIGSVPVCQSKDVVGIITDRDITLRTVAKGLDSRSQNVRDVMSSNPIIASPDMEISEASKLMSDRQIRRLPIVENKQVVGMVALGDLAVEPSLGGNAKDALTNISEPCSPSI